MVIANTDLKLFHSGGGANSTIANDIAGDISSVEITDNSLNDLWDDVSGDEGSAGDTEYRKIFFKNAHGSLVAQSAVLWVLTQTTSSSDAVAIGLDPAGSGAAGADIANESTAPAGVSFTAPSTKGTGLSLGSPAAGVRYAIWVRRVVDASASAADANSYVLKIECDSAA